MDLSKAEIKGFQNLTFVTTSTIFDVTSDPEPVFAMIFSKMYSTEAAFKVILKISFVTLLVNGC